MPSINWDKIGRREQLQTEHEWVKDENGLQKQAIAIRRETILSPMLTAEEAYEVECAVPESTWEWNENNGSYTGKPIHLHVNRRLTLTQEEFDRLTTLRNSKKKDAAREAREAAQDPDIETVGKLQETIKRPRGRPRLNREGALSQ